MTDAQWAQVWQLFESSQGMSAEERRRVLGSAALDEGQLAEVEALLELSLSFTTNTHNDARAFNGPTKTYLSPGDLVGRYTIVRVIGEGGFGQVYAARDRDLRRDVAVKLLYPSAHGSVAQALEEARAASALNHPNILTVYETIEHGDRAAIVTELVGGQSLRQILLNRNKSLPLTEALPIARQITAALQEAHSTGITHRDVKPENVLVRLKDGLVKLVDFGLAVDASDGNRVSGVAGTLRYSAPEQLSGLPPTPASDVFALGIVVYEMLAGVHPFRRDTPMEAAMAIMATDAEGARNLPRSVERLLLEMLDRHPLKRPKTLQVLERLAAVEETIRVRRRIPAILLTAAAAVLLVLVLFFAGRWFFRQGKLQLSLNNNARLLTGALGQETFPAISPDGKYVIYQWQQPGVPDAVTLVRNIESDEATPLRIRGPFKWLPGGHRVGFIRHTAEADKLCSINVNGTDEQCLLEARDLAHFDWSPDGEHIVYSAAGSSAGPRAIFCYSRRTRNAVQITFPPSGSNGDEDLSISPDGARLAFRRTFAVSASDIFEMDLRHPGSPKQISFNRTEGEAIAWLRDGTGLITSMMQGAHFSLWLYDLLSRTAPARLTEVGVEAFSVSIAHDRNRMVWTNNMDDSNVWRVPVDGGAPQRVLGSKTRERDVDWSSQGLLAYRSDRSGYPEIWIARADGTDERKVTNLQAFTGSPRWSPEGRRLVFDSLKPHAGSDLFLMHCEPESLKCGQPVQLTFDPANDSVPSWSADGRYIYFGSQRSGKWQTWRIGADGGQQPTQVTYLSGLYAMESRDGKWLYYSRIDSRETTGVWRRPASYGKEGNEAVESPGELVAPMTFRSTATWVVRDNNLYFSQFDTGPRKEGIWVRSLLSGQEKLIHAAGTTPLSRGLAVSPDGRSLMYSQTDNSDSNIVVSDFSAVR